MAFVPAPNIVQLEFRVSLDGQQCENRVMVDCLVPVTEAIVGQLAAVGRDWMINHEKNFLTGDVTLVACQATDMSALNGSQVLINLPADTTGEQDGPTEPNEVSFCIKLGSGSRGRSARGRFYVVGVPRPFVSANRVTGAWADQVTSNLVALADAVSDWGGKLVIVSYISQGVPRPGGPVYFEVVTIGYTDLIVDSQRSRRPGVGT